MNFDWQSLGFSYRQTDRHIRYTWKDGMWDEGELHSDPFVPIHIAATALHYGQSAFEGLKAFHCKDGKIRIFRAIENARRLNATSERILMPSIPESMFIEAVHRVVKQNRKWIPPYGEGGALYIRPLLFGSGARIGVKPSGEYIFLIFVVPVGDYYKGGLTPVNALVVEGYDRTAPQGLGHVKVAGNYAADLIPNQIAKNKGYPINLYLDAREHRYVDEFGTSNFIGITGGSYITPDSSSVLPSVTNKTLMTLAEAEGLKIEVRPIDINEIKSFSEVGACGTAVVLTPIQSISFNGEVIEIGERGKCGPVLQDLYNKVRGIQTGEIADEYGWTTVVE